MVSLKSRQDYYRSIFVVFLAIFAYLSFRVVSPIMDSIVMGAVMAYIFFPVYNLLDETLKRPQASAFIVCVLIAVLSVVSILVVGKAIADDASTVYASTKGFLTSESLFGACPHDSGAICAVMRTVQSWVSDPQVRAFIDDGAHALGQIVFAKTSQMLYAIPQFMIFVAVSFFISFYLFIDGRRLLERIRKSLPIRKDCQKVIFTRIAALTRAVIFGSILVSIIQGIVGSIGFILLGVSEPIMWGALMAVFAMIPYVGTALVWIPAAIGLIAKGSVVKGIILFAYGGLVISMVDNLLKPLIISSSADIHPLMVFLGVIGGIAFMGPLGFIVGPVILAIFEALIEIYETEKGEIV